MFPERVNSNNNPNLYKILKINRILKNAGRTTKKNLQKTLKSDKIDEKSAYKHALTSSFINKSLHILQDSNQVNIRKLKIKKVDSEVDWSVLAELNESELHNLIKDYVIADKKWKANLNVVNLMKFKPVGPSWRRTTDPTEMNSTGKTRLNASCTYENCGLKSIPLYKNISTCIDHFKIHVLSQHMNIVNGQCQYCALPVTNNFRDLVRKKLVSQHHFRKHLPVELWPFSCGLCSDKFIYPHLLRDHIKSEHSGNQFACFICGPNGKIYSRFRAATGRGGLAGHLQNVHGIFGSSASWKSLEKERSTVINFKSKYNGDTARETLKKHGYDVDVEYKEQKFAMNYHPDLSRLFEEVGQKDNEIHVVLDEQHNFEVQD